jgi:hypothetical protein
LGAGSNDCSKDEIAIEKMCEEPLLDILELSIPAGCYEMI